MKNHLYTNEGLLGQDFPTILFEKTTASTWSGEHVWSKSSGKCPIVSVKIPESEKYLTPYRRLKGDKIQMLFNSTDAHCNAGKFLPNFGQIFLPFLRWKRPNFRKMFFLSKRSKSLDFYHAAPSWIAWRIKSRLD